MTPFDRPIERTSGRRGRPSRKVVLNLIVIAIMVLWLVPTFGLLFNSFRPAVDVSGSGWWTSLVPPWNFNLDNYRHVLSQNDIGEAFVNSLFITIPSTIIPVAVAAFAAYAFSWMSFRGRDLLFVVIVGLLVIPLQTTFIPLLRLLGPQGIELLGPGVGSFVAIWFAHAGYGLPFAIYLLRNYMGGLPREVFESAAIDGASHVTAFFRLAVPMSVPAIASLAIFQFLFVWNDLLVALIFIGATNAPNLPLTVAVANLSNSLGGEWQFLMAAAFLSMILPLAVFFALQRYFVRGITGGAVKG
ncbi:MAG: sugar ABC transporter permease [Anaerolinea sp.]|jgi:alpha-glucoside transport system permease protein|nr:sugar ABC transporter permease [Anaerolinea sp.]